MADDMDKLGKAIARTGMRAKKVIASGELDGGLKKSGASPKPVKTMSLGKFAKGNKGAY